MRDLSALVAPGQLVDTENLTTLVRGGRGAGAAEGCWWLTAAGSSIGVCVCGGGGGVVVGKQARNDWLAQYEGLTEFVVPRSSEVGRRAVFCERLLLALAVYCPAEESNNRFRACNSGSVFVLFLSIRGIPYSHKPRLKPIPTSPGGCRGPGLPRLLRRALPPRGGQLQNRGAHQGLPGMQMPAAVPRQGACQLGAMTQDLLGAGHLGGMIGAAWTPPNPQPPTPPCLYTTLTPT